MKVIKTDFEGLLILEPTVRMDSRGYFFEAYNKKSLEAAGIPMEFVQDNQSRSTRGVLRGLHYQKPPFAQTKLVRVLQGAIQDVVVDLRSSASTFGKHYSIELSSNNNRQLLVPRGFAHGFLVLSEAAEVLYKCDTYYHPEAEGGILYSDSALDIAWMTGLHEALVSDRDQGLKSFADSPPVF